MKKTIYLIAIIGLVAACNSTKKTTTTTTTTSPAPKAELACTDYVYDLRKDIVPIISEYCVSCHSMGNNVGGYDFTITQHIERAANNGSLLGTIKGEKGFPRMPEGGAPLDKAIIEKIECWVKQEKAK
jgi:hypothetical protein